MGWTLQKFDQDGRLIAATAYDGRGLPAPWGSNTSLTGTTTTYDAETTTVTDPAGKARRSSIDGLGRLLQVVEAPSVLNYTTNYGYDALNNLTSVSQGSQSRTFAYTSLSRLSSATNPESGTYVEPHFTPYFASKGVNSICSLGGLFYMRVDSAGRLSIFPNQHLKIQPGMTKEPVSFPGKNESLYWPGFNVNHSFTFYFEHVHDVCLVWAFKTSRHAAHQSDFAELGHRTRRVLLSSSRQPNWLWTVQRLSTEGHSGMHYADRLRGICLFLFG